jgi:hypothetical protein
LEVIVWHVSMAFLSFVKSVYFVFLAVMEETSGLLVSDAVSRSSSPTAQKTANAHNPALLNTVSLLKAKRKADVLSVRRTSSYSPGT